MLELPWEKALSLPPGVILSGEGTADRHSIAAICLYGQPFGFTREDATNLRALRVFVQTGFMPTLESRADIEDWLVTHIDRIEALLPPFSENPGK